MKKLFAAILVFNLSLACGVAQTNVRAFGATGNGITDDTLAIQAAIDSANANGGGVVYFPPGTYIIRAHERSNFPGYYSGICTYGDMTLQGAGQGATILKAGPGQIDQSWLVSNFNIGYDLDRNIKICDLTVDGDTANQGANRMNRGICVWRARYVIIENVTVKNVRGITNVGGSNGEGVEFDASMCTDVTMINCTATADGLGVSTGFGGTGTTNLRFSNCTASGLITADGQWGMGFSVYGDSGVQFENCRAFSCAYTQFNVENSSDVSFYNCMAGGNSAESWETPNQPGTFYEKNTNLGGQYGFIFSISSNHIQVYGGSSGNNSVAGFWLSGVNYITLGTVDITGNPKAIKKTGTIPHLKISGCQGVADRN